jgi:hypothetical protein
VPYSATVAAPDRRAAAAETTDTVEFTVVGVPSADYLVRVRVDGAETPLTAGANGTFVGPQVSLS